MTTREDRLSALIEPVVVALGCGLWGIDFFSRGASSVLRVYIERVDEGISIDDCERVSRQLGSVFDVEDPMAGEYTLEVSSPGMDRPLFCLDQYRMYVGEDISLRLRVPFEGRRKYRGKLTAVVEDEIVLEMDEHEYVFPLASIDRANLIPRF
ncbi:MAG: ribosome maturation factor RimP [Porticoccaceae bacterium]